MTQSARVVARADPDKKIAPGWLRCHSEVIGTLQPLVTPHALTIITKTQVTPIPWYPYWPDGNNQPSPLIQLPPIGEGETPPWHTY